MPDLFYEGHVFLEFLSNIQRSFVIQSQDFLQLIRTKSFNLIQVGKWEDLKISAVTSMIILCLHSAKPPLKTGSRMKFGHNSIPDIAFNNKIMGRKEYGAKAGKNLIGCRRVVISGNSGLVWKFLFWIQQAFNSSYNMQSQKSFTSSPSWDVTCLKKLTERQALHGDPICFPFFICHHEEVLCLASASASEARAAGACTGLMALSFLICKVYPRWL